MCLPAFVCLSVCLSVCEQDYSKMCARIWMKCCVSTDVRTWTNWLTFEPDPDAWTGLLSPISYALQCGILLRREKSTYRYWAPVAAATGGFKMVLFTASRGNTFVGGTCASPSTLLVSWMTRHLFHCLYGVGSWVCLCVMKSAGVCVPCITADSAQTHNLCSASNLSLSVRLSLCVSVCMTGWCW